MRDDWVKYIDAELQVGLDPKQWKVMIEDVLLIHGLHQAALDLFDLLSEGPWREISFILTSVLNNNTITYIWKFRHFD